MYKDRAATSMNCDYVVLKLCSFNFKLNILMMLKIDIKPKRTFRKTFLLWLAVSNSTKILDNKRKNAVAKFKEIFALGLDYTCFNNYSFVVDNTISGI